MCEEETPKSKLGQHNSGEPGPLGLPKDVENDVFQAGKKEIGELDWRKTEELLQNADSLRNRK